MSDHLTAEEACNYLQGNVTAERVEEIQDHICHCRRCADLILDAGSFLFDDDHPAPWEAWDGDDRRGPREFGSWIEAAVYLVRSWLRRLPWFDRRGR